MHFHIKYLNLVRNKKMDSILGHENRFVFYFNISLKSFTLKEKQKKYRISEKARNSFMSTKYIFDDKIYFCRQNPLVENVF